MSGEAIVTLAGSSGVGPFDPFPPMAVIVGEPRGATTQVDIEATLPMPFMLDPAAREIAESLPEKEACLWVATQFEAEELREIFVDLLFSCRTAVVSNSLEPVVQELSSIIATAEVLTSPELLAGRKRDEGPGAISGEEFISWLKIK